MPEDIKKRAESCKTREELFALAKEVGHELTDEELERISGGEWDFCYSYRAPYWITTCGHCGGTAEWPKSEPQPAHCFQCSYPLVIRNSPSS